VAGLRSRSQSRRFLGGVGVGFLTTLAVGVGIFCPTPAPDDQLDHFLHHTLKLGIPVEMVQFLLKLLLKQIFCCAPRFPLILTAKFHSLYVKESELEILERSESAVGVWNFGKSVSEILERSELESESDILLRPATLFDGLTSCMLKWIWCSFEDSYDNFMWDIQLNADYYCNILIATVQYCWAISLRDILPEAKKYRAPSFWCLRRNSHSLFV